MGKWTSSIANFRLGDFIAVINWNVVFTHRSVRGGRTGLTFGEL